MEVDILISNPKIISPRDLAMAIGAPPGAKLRLCRDAAATGRQGQSRMTLHCDTRTAFNLRHRFSVPRSYAHDSQLTSLTFVGMRPTVVGEGGHRHHDSLGASSHDGAAAVPLPPGGKGGGGGAGRGGGRKTKSSRLRATMTPPTTPSSSPAAGVEVALENVDRAEADGGRVPGIAALYKEFLRRRTRKCRGQRNSSSDGGEEKLGDCWANGGSTEFAITAKDEEKFSSAHEAIRSSSTVHRRPRQRRLRFWNEKQEKEENEDEKQEERDNSNVTELRWRRGSIAAHQWRWRQRGVVASVEDVTSALNQISREYSDAPGPFERAGVVLLLAKLYADGTVFADNRPRDAEMLDRLGIMQWRARANSRVPSSSLAQQSESGSTDTCGGWHRLLWRVVGLVRGIADFGVFVQVYVAAIDEEGTRREDAKARGGDKESRAGWRQRGGRTASLLQAHSGLIGGRVDDGRSERRSCRSRCDRRLFLEATDAAAAAAAATITGTLEHLPDEREEGASTAGRLLWLFPESSQEGGRRAFGRHTVCGGANNALITLESAVAIVRDAGKVLPLRLAWRWGHDSRKRDGKLRWGHLLGFHTFVEMCEELRDHMNVSIISQEFCTPATCAVPVAIDSSSVSCPSVAT